MDSTFEHPETLEETPPTILLNIWDIGTDFISTYGWFLLIILLVVVYFWETIQSWLDERYKQQSDREYDAKCKKDPDWMRQRQLEMEAARNKMQEEMNAKAALHAAKLKEREEMRRAELLASSSVGGCRLGDSETSGSKISQSLSSSKKSHRPEYNPLMGSGGSGGYRPPRRGCPGGGCG